MTGPFLYLRRCAVASLDSDTSDSVDTNTPPTSLFLPTLVREEQIQNESCTYISHVDKILRKMFNPLNFSPEDTYALQIIFFP